MDGWVDGWMDGWMDGIDHQDSCASCRFHVLRVGSLWLQYSSTVGWRYFKEMVGVELWDDLRKYCSQKSKSKISFLRCVSASTI